MGEGDGHVFSGLADWEIWACAYTVEMHYGSDGPSHIHQQIGALALAGDEGGVATWQRIAAAFDALTSEPKQKQ